MNKVHKRTAILLFLFPYIFFIVLDMDISGLYSNVLTIVSILLGFYMAALSTMYGKQHIKNLYCQIDQNKKTNTKLHTLINYFKWSVKLGICTVFISIGSMVIESLIKRYSCEWIPYLLRIVSSAVVPLLMVDFYFMWQLLKAFFVGLIEEAREK